MDDVWILGVGTTPFGVHADRTVRDLAGGAIRDACADAGAELGDVGVGFYGCTSQGALEGQLMIGGELTLRGMGSERIPIYNVENACATGASALSLAVAHVRAGLVDVALAVGVEKMNVGDREKTMTVFAGGYDVSHPELLNDYLGSDGANTPRTDAKSHSIFMDIYAAGARRHMELYGTTQLQLAEVSAKNHRHAEDNPNAHFRKRMSAAEVLSGRALSFPFTVPMCSPITDGAAAVLVGNQSAVKHFTQSRPVRVLACVVGTGMQAIEPGYQTHLSALAAARAYEQAAVGPAEVSVAEVHDATAFAEVLQSELLGLCAEGEGGPIAARGETSIGGRIPINPSGGLESKGHPLAATGLAQVHELVLQLRGDAGSRQVEGARIALAENGGGFYNGEEAVTAVTILAS